MPLIRVAVVWPNRDPIGEIIEENLYRFVKGNSISKFDPAGLFDLISPIPPSPALPIIPQPPTLTPPPVPQPPGENQPPPCLPYPDCLRVPHDSSYAECVNSCYNTLPHLQLPDPIKHAGVMTALWCRVANPTNRFPLILGIPALWDASTYTGCLIGCAIVDAYMD